MTGPRYKVTLNERTHMVAECATGRWLGACGANFYRPWVFPLYTPRGLTVVREFPFDHPFHNGVFVGQQPVLVAGRTGNLWAAPPARSFDDKLSKDVGRVDLPKGQPEVEIAADGVRFTFRGVWRDEQERPVIDEVRTVAFRAVEDATICDVTSEKIATYGPAEYPRTKFGAVGARVETRLLPPLGGVILADAGRRGGAEVVHESESDFVAYENDLPGAGRVGLLMHILDEGVRGPWFIRDYGMAMYNPTWAGPVFSGRGQSWTVSLRVVAYDGAATEERARTWLSVD
jgi:hypothetical protein